MPVTQSGDNITVADAPVEEETKTLSVAEIRDQVLISRSELNALVHEQMASAVADVERRLSQAREIERANATGVARTSVHAEDINSTQHVLEGYTLSSNTPANGSIAWANLHIVYLGVDYTITNSNTDKKYIWFVKPASGTSATLNAGNTVPMLGPDDQLIFINIAGAAIPANSSISYAVANGTITDAQIVDGSITPLKTSFYTTLSTAISNAQDAATLAQATADGAIVTYFQPDAPWPAGSTQPASKVGDIWYDSDDGQAYRWSGGSGSPANTWVLIKDSQIGAALNAANTAQQTANSRITTFYAASTATPTALAIGDLWIVTDQGNKLKRATSTGTGGWIDVLIGDGGLASGISGTKIGPGINGGNVSNGTINNLQLGTGAVQAKNVNTAFHILY